MKLTTKNKINILFWLLLIGLSIFFSIIKSEISSWIHTLVYILIAILNISNLRVVSLVNDDLIIKRLFSNEKKYDLNTITHWNEIDYSLLGIKTYRKIIIQIANDKKIYIFQNDSIYFEKISDYLNDNWSRKFDNIK